jgi:DNA polymerase I-like protein with 3'-5' exonuclease and polymerase domains
MTSTRQGGQFKAPPLHPLDRNRRLALAYVDDRLFDAGIEGGPVAWLHDEIVLEVREDYADRAVEIFKQAMVDGFAETFPGAPLNGLVDLRIAGNWAEAKG